MISIRREVKHSFKIQFIKFTHLNSREEKPEKHYRILLNGKLVFLQTHTHTFAKNWIGGNLWSFLHRYHLNEGNSFPLELYLTSLQCQMLKQKEKHTLNFCIKKARKENPFIISLQKFFSSFTLNRHRLP